MSVNVECTFLSIAHYFEKTMFGCALEIQSSLNRYGIKAPLALAFSSNIRIRNELFSPKNVQIVVMYTVEG